MTAPTQTPALFGDLPPNLFRLFSGKARWFYADLVAYLEESVFAEAGGVIAQPQLVEAIEEYIDRQARDIEFDPAEEAEGAEEPPPPVQSRATFVFWRLQATGWIVVHRDRRRRLVDFDGGARLVLQTLLDLRAGRLRSYGGGVLEILTLMEAAAAHPAERSENIRTAAKRARSFQYHLRTISSAMRKAEEHIAGQSGLQAVFRSFFDDFVSEHLIEDFKNLHTRANPFRFRVQILAMAEELVEDHDRLERLAAGYVAEGRAPDRDRAVQVLAEDLNTIARVFRQIDTYLEVIEETNSRIERRIRNTVRYMDRIANSRSERVQLALHLLGSTALGQDETLPLDGRMLALNPVTGRRNLFTPARSRVPYRPPPLRRVPEDPAHRAYVAALRAYQAHWTIAPAKVRAYVDQAIGAAGTARAADLPLTCLEDFVIFERLRAIPYGDDQDLRESYRVDLTGGRFESPWITCPDFTISRFTISRAASAKGSAHG